MHDKNAQDLLADILRDTEEAAQREEAKQSQQRAALQRSRQEAKARKTEAEKERATAMIAAEQQRQAQSALRRSQMLRPPEAPPLAAPPAPDPLKDTRQKLQKAENARLKAEAQAQEAQLRASRAPQRPTPQPPAKSDNSPLFKGLLIAGVAMSFALVLLVGGGLAIVLGQSPNITPGTYAKVVYQADANTSASTERGFRGIPKIDKTRPPKTTRKQRPSRKNPTRKPRQKVQKPLDFGAHEDVFDARVK